MVSKSSFCFYHGNIMYVFYVEWRSYEVRGVHNPYHKVLLELAGSYEVSTED